MKKKDLINEYIGIISFIIIVILAVIGVYFYSSHPIHEKTQAPLEVPAPNSSRS